MFGIHFERTATVVLVCFLVGLLAAPTGVAQVVTRGPYLQSGTATNILVRWRTDAATDSVVLYGTRVDDLSSLSSSSPSTTEHEVALTGLQADTVYFYSVGSSSRVLAGGDASYFFETAPLSGTPKRTRIWVLGDSGFPDEASIPRDEFYSWNGSPTPDLWIMLGDNAYRDGTDPEYQAAVFEMYPRTLRSSVLWSTVGNHDARSSDSLTQSGVYFDIFSFPRGGEAGGLASGTEAYYAFDYAHIHFICLDSHETDRALDGAMFTWLENDLAVNTQKWTIAFWHHPPYTKGSHDSDDPLDSGGRLTEMRERALPMLESAGVDLVLCGHSHSYERSFFLHGHYGTSLSFSGSMVRDAGDGRVQGSGAYTKSGEEAAVYVVAGSSSEVEFGPLNHPAMFVSLSELGSFVLDVDVDRLDATFVGQTGLTDSFTIIKGAGNGFVTDQSEVSESAGSVDVLIRLLESSPVTRTIDIEVANHTALQAEDFMLDTTRVTFLPNETEKVVTLLISDDLVREPNEWIDIRLVNPSEIVLGNNITHRLTVIDDDRTFTAYNDLSWAPGQLNANITRYTTESGNGTPPEGSAGFLVDHASGAKVHAQIMVSQGGWSGNIHANQGGLSQVGTDAHGFFHGFVDTQGIVGPGAVGSGDLLVELSGLNPRFRYELVAYGNRAKSTYTDRVTKVSLLDAASFTNASSVGAFFSSPEDASTIVTNGYNSEQGLVARYVDVNPGQDGTVSLQVADGGSGSPPKFYLNAVMVKANDPTQNQPPQVNAGLDGSVALPAVFSLAAVVTDDGLPSPPGVTTSQWSMVSGPGLVTFSDPSSSVTTASFSLPGTYEIRISVYDGEFIVHDELEIEASPEDQTTFTAYNDLSWAEGQTQANITRYTTSSGSGTPPMGSFGNLVDYDTGSSVPAVLSVVGGNWNGSNHTTQGALPFAGTEGHSVFSGKVDPVGIIGSTSSQTSAKLRFSGLNPNLRYTLVAFGNRDRSSYRDRVTQATLENVDSFKNESTPGSGFSGVSDPSTVVTNGYNRTQGYVIRFTEIASGLDGAFDLSIADGGSAAPPKFYLNALMLRAEVPVLRAPTAIGDRFTVPEDAVGFPLRVFDDNGFGEDTDLDGDAIRLHSVGRPNQGGTVWIHDQDTPLDFEDDLLLYTPTPDFVGEESFTYEITDGTFLDAAVVTVTVININDDPVAKDDTFIVAEDSQAHRFDLFSDNGNGIDEDIDADPLSIVGITAPDQGGKISLVAADDRLEASAGLVSYTPRTDYSGSESFQYVIDDGRGGQSMGTVRITVQNLNDAPVALDDRFDVIEDSSGNVLRVLEDNGSGVDIDVDGDVLLVAAVGTPDQGGSAQILSTQDGISYSPAMNFQGEERFTYDLIDGMGGVAQATVTVVVQNENDSPMAQNDRFTVPEDSLETLLNVRDDNGNGADKDPDGDVLVLVSVGHPNQGGQSYLSLGGTPEDPSDDSVAYRPAPDFIGFEVFSYTLSDGVLEDTALVSVTVLNVDNDPPLAFPDHVQVLEDSLENSLQVLDENGFGRDRDPDGDPIIVQGVGFPSQGGSVFVSDHGTPSDPSDDVLSYRPRPNFIGIETFTYSVSDEVFTDITLVSVTVLNADNDPPQAQPDRFVVNEDTVNNLLDVKADHGQGQDSDPDGDPLLLLELGRPNHGGTLTVENKGTPEDMRDDIVRYSPAEDFIGLEVFTYTIGDGEFVAVGTVTVLVQNANNDPPRPRPDLFNVAEDSTNNPLEVVADNGFGPDIDPDDDALLVRILDPPDQGGEVSVQASVAPSPLRVEFISYTPAPDFVGVESFSYEVSDGVFVASERVTVTVTNANADAPLAQDDTFTVVEDSQNNRLSVLEDHGSGPDQDPDGDSVILALVSVPNQGGEVMVHDNGTPLLFSDDYVDYSPLANFFGEERFSYMISDGILTDTAHVTVTVNNADNDSPIAFNDRFTVNEDEVDQPLEVLLDQGQGADLDPDGDNLLLRAVTQPDQGGRLRLNDNNTPSLGSDDFFVYTPAAHFVGLEIFTYEISDGIFQDVATVSVTVLNVNDDPPLARNDRFVVQEDSVSNRLFVLMDNGAGMDEEPDGTPLVITTLSVPSHGGEVVKLASSEEPELDQDVVVYTPAPDFMGNETFSYQVTDGAFESTAVVTVTVNNANNDSPKARDDSFLVNEDAVEDALFVLQDNGQGADFEPDGDPFSIAKVGTPSQGGRTILRDNTTPLDPSDDYVGYTPSPNFIGVASFTYTITDGVLTDEGLVTVTVENVDNDAPIAQDDRFSVPEDSLENRLTVLQDHGNGADEDPEGQPVFVRTVGRPGSGGSVFIPEDDTPLDPSDDYLVYRPKPNFIGIEVFTYTGSDGLLTDDARVTVTITNQDDDRPVAIDDAFTVPEDSKDNRLAVLLDNGRGADHDPDGEPLFIGAVGQPSRTGSVLIQESGTPFDPSDDYIAYSPDEDFIGVETFTYTVFDGALMDEGRVTVTVVNQNNDSPIAKADRFNVDEDSLENRLTVLLDHGAGRDEDPDGDNVLIIDVGETSHQGVARWSDNLTPLDPADDYISYEPKPNFSGAEMFTYTISDGVLTAEGRVTVTVTNRDDDPPVAQNDSFTVEEDSGEQALAVLQDHGFGPDEDPEQQVLSLVRLGVPSQSGSVRVLDSGTRLDPVDDTVGYTPGKDFIGLEVFTYTITDGELLGVGLVTVTVLNADNDPPLARNDRFTVNEDSRMNRLLVLLDQGGGKDEDPDQETVALIAVGAPDQGGVALVRGEGTPFDGNDDVVEYTPSPNFIGSEVFTYTITDGVFTDEGLVTVTVTNADNDPPMAQDDLFAVEEDSVGNRLSVLLDNGNGSDEDPDAQAVSLHGVGKASSQGSVSLEGLDTPSDPSDDRIVYDPYPHFIGMDTFTYTITDGTLTDVGRVTVTVHQANNDAPVARDDSFTVQEDSQENALTVLQDHGLGPDHELDGEPLQIVKVSDPSHGGTAVWRDNHTALDPSDDYVGYRPVPSFIGVETFTYTISDGVLSDVARVTVTVVNVDNDPPLARQDEFVLERNSVANLLRVYDDNGHGVDSDPENQELRIVSVSVPDQGGIAALDDRGTGETSTDDVIAYTPSNNFVGFETFTYTLSDGVHLSTALVSVTVVDTDNLAPVAVDDRFNVVEDSERNRLSVLADHGDGEDSDPDGDVLTLHSVGVPNRGGSVRIDRNGTPSDPSDDVLEYTPAQNRVGEEVFTYKISDGLLTAQALVTVTIQNSDNDPPVAMNDSFLVHEDSSTNRLSVLEANGLGEDSDPDGDAVGVSAVGQPNQGGVVTVSGDGGGNGMGDAISYTPAVDFIGLETFTYTLTDGSLSSDAVVTVTVINTNDDPPVAGDDLFEVLEDGGKSLFAVTEDNGFGVDFDPDRTPIELLHVGVPSQGGQARIVPRLANLQQGVLAGTNLDDENEGPPGDLIDYLSAVNFSGVETFTYTITDGLFLSSARVTVTVRNRDNDPPMAKDDQLVVLEDTHGNALPVLSDNGNGRDVDPEGEPLTLVSWGRPNQGGVIQVDDRGTPEDPFDDLLLYTPPSDFIGLESLTYTVTDGVLVDSATVSITVENNDNDPPEAKDDLFTIAEDSVANKLDVLQDNGSGVDIEKDGQNLTVVALGLPDQGATVFIHDNGTPATTLDDFISYAPSSDFVGTEVFTYTVTDGLLNDTATVRVMVFNSDNDAPIGRDDIFFVEEDTRVNVLAVLSDNGSGADIDVDGDRLLLRSITKPDQGGQVSIKPRPDLFHPDDDVLLYSPAAQFFGTERFTYEVSDRHGKSVHASVTVHVRDINDAPSAQPDSFSVDENSVDVVLLLMEDNGSGEDVDIEGDSLRLFAVGRSDQGGAVQIASERKSVLYTPVPDFNGTESFTYTVQDDRGALATTTVQVEVLQVNQAPIARPDIFHVLEDTSDQILTPLADNGAGEDSDPDGDPIELHSLGSPDQGGAVRIASDRKSVLYTPMADFIGTEVMTYSVSDGTLSHTSLVTVAVENVNNDAPQARDDRFTVEEDSPVLPLPVLADNGLGADEDPDLDDLLLSQVGEPSLGGRLELKENELLYTPAPNRIGDEVFTYTVSDGELSDDAVVTVTLTNVDNDPPLARDDRFSVREDSVGNRLSVLADTGFGADEDPERDDLFVVAVGTPDRGARVEVHDNTVLYTPVSDLIGEEVFTYTLSDGGRKDTATVVVTVTNADNDPPVAQDDRFSVDEDSFENLLSVFQDTGMGPDVDPDNDPLVIEEIGRPDQGGQLALDDNETPEDPSDDRILYTPLENFTGIERFSYRISDRIFSSSANVVVEVHNRDNDAPVAHDDFFTVKEGSVDHRLAVLSDNGAGPDEDPEGDSLSIRSVGSPDQGGAVTLSGTEVVYQPLDGFSGTETFTYTITDGQGADSARVVVTVDSRNNTQPVAQDDRFTVEEDSSENLLRVLADNGLGPDLDPDGDTLVLQVLEEPNQGGQVVVSADAQGAHLRYTPAPDFIGEERLVYRLSDGVLFDTAAVHVTVQNVDQDEPTARHDRFDVEEDSRDHPLFVLRDNGAGPDVDPDGDVLEIRALGIPSSGGSVVRDALLTSLGNEDVVRYTSQPDFVGVEIFTYTLSDGFFESTASVTVTVRNTNADPPSAQNDVFSVQEDSARNLLTVLEDHGKGRDTDPDGDMVRIVAVGKPTKGGVAVVDDAGSPLEPDDDVIAYEPAQDFIGVDTFTYTISDGALVGIALVTVTVQNANEDPPVALDDRFVVEEDLVQVPLPVLTGSGEPDFDPDQDRVALHSVGALSERGLLEVSDEGTPEDPFDDLVLYTPGEDFIGRRAVHLYHNRWCPSRCCAGHDNSG